MLKTFIGWFRPPLFPDKEDRTRQALLLNVVLITFIIAFPILFVGTMFSGGVPRLERIQIIILITWTLLVGARFVMHTGRVALAGTVTVAIIFIAATFAIYNLGTVRAPAASLFLVAVVMSGLIISRRAILWVACLGAITFIALLLAEVNDILPEPSLAITPTQGVTFTVGIAITAILLYLAVKSIDEALMRARQELEERQHAEGKLRASEERFRAMIENISDAIALVDANLAIQYISPAAEHILGYPNSERIGSSALENLARPEDVETMQDVIEKLLTNPAEKRFFMLQARHQDDSLHWIEATATNLLDLPSVHALVVNYRDITERIHAEQERERYIDELGRQNAELERFTYTVSHDLRNPLVTIRGFLGALQNDLQDGRQDRLQSDFQRIAGAAEKMDKLLSDLLELSRIGRITNPPMEIDPIQLIQEAIDNMDAGVRSENVALHIPPDMPTLYGDRIRLREVFENLIDNAIKYAGEQNNPVIEIGAQNSGNETTFFVKDNGIGIESKYHAKIFGLFEKLNPSIEGTGIGLALIKRIVETHGGKIWVESEGLLKGSTFYFTIPNGKIN